EQSRCRIGRPQSHAAFPIPIANRPEPTEQYQIYLWAKRVDSPSDQTAARLWRRIYRLVTTGIRDRGMAIRRSRNDRSVFVGGSVSRVCKAGWPGSRRRD